MLKIVHERGWLYLGHRSTEWCPRCGTSISQHELDRALRRPRRPVALRPLPAARPAGRVARHLDDDAVDAAGERRRRREPGRRVRPPRERRVGRGAALPRRDLRGDAAGRGARRLALPGPVRRARRRARPSSTASSRGTRSRSTRAPASSTSRPGCGAEDFELSASHDLPVLTPVDESGRFYDDYGWLHGLSTVEAAEQIIGNLEEQGSSSRPGCTSTAIPSAGAATRRSSSASPTTGSSRSRPAPADARRERDGRVDAASTWASAWTTGSHNMGDWNISRRRYYGLPLPFYPCACGHLNVIGSKRRARGARARRPRRSSRSCAGRGSTACRSAARSAASRSSAIKEVGDVWLDAGIVPFSTLGWQNAEWVDGGYATGAARGLTRRRPARPRVLGEVVPRRLGLGDARADPALVLLAALHVGRADRRAPFRQRARLREDARRDGPRDARLVGEH